MVDQRRTTLKFVIVAVVTCLATFVLLLISTTTTKPRNTTRLMPPRRALSEAYDENEAKVMLKYATISYCDVEAIKAFTCAICGDDITPLLTITSVVEDKENSLQAYVGWRTTSTNNNDEKKDIIVAFRGTIGSSVENWLNNIDLVSVSPWANENSTTIPSDVSVHAGFFDAWNHLKPDIVKEIQNLQGTLGGSPDIYLTGHSLGGAMACFCAFELHYEYGISVSKVYTYGKPRVGNDKFKDAYNKLTSQHWRLTHGRDPVPQYPLRMLGYHHVPTEVFYNKGSTSYVIGDGSGESKNGQDSICFGIACMDPSDHTNYLNMTTGDKGCQAPPPPTPSSSAGDTINGPTPPTPAPSSSTTGDTIPDDPTPTPAPSSSSGAAGQCFKHYTTSRIVIMAVIAIFST